MTQTTLVIVDKEGVYALTAHWRHVKELLQKTPQSKLQKNGPGYVVLDLNKKLVLNAQQEFALQKLKGFEVVQV